MGILKRIKDKLVAINLSTVLDVGFDDNLLTYQMVNKINDSLNEYQKQLKKLPRSFAEFVRVSNNFCKHVIKTLKEYQDVMVFDADSETYSDYKSRLDKALSNISKECDNKSITCWDKNTWEGVFKDRAVTWGSNTRCIGEFAGLIKNAAGNTVKEINLENYRTKLGLDKIGSAKRIISKLKPNITDSLSDKVSRAVSSAVHGIKKTVAETFLEHTVEPIEYYKFRKDQYLGRSTVHAVLNILNSYKTDLKDYPRDLKGVYVDPCLKVIDKINSMLKSYLLSLEVFMNSKRKRLDEIKARQNMKKILEDLESEQCFADNDKKDCSIFCLADKEMKSSNKQISGLDLEYKNYNQDRNLWPKIDGRQEGFWQGVKRKIKGQGNTKNDEGQEIVLRGWSLGHFLAAMAPVVKRTAEDLSSTLINFDAVDETKVIDYEKLEMKNPNPARDDAKSDKNKKDILEIIKKADLLKRHIEDLYRRVQIVLPSKAFKDAFESEKTGVADAYTKVFGNSGIYSKFLNEDKEIGYWRNGTFKIVLGLISPLKPCTEHFSKMSAYAKEIEEIFNKWIKLYSSSATAEERSRKEEAKKAKNTILQNSKLFKNKFSKIFAEATDILKKADKEHKDIIKRITKGADGDLLASYKKTVSQLYGDVIDKIEFSVPIGAEQSKRSFLLFDQDGLKEDNLYNCVSLIHQRASSEITKDDGDFNNFLTKIEGSLTTWLESLRNSAQALKTNYDEIKKLFSRKNKGNFKKAAVDYEKILAYLKKAISQYGSAKELKKKYDNEFKSKFEAIKKNDKYNIILSARNNNDLDVYFEKHNGILESIYNMLRPKDGRYCWISEDNKINTEKVKADCLDTENHKLGLIPVNFFNNIKKELDLMQENLKKIEGEVKWFDENKVQIANVYDYSQKIEEHYKAAEKLQSDPIFSEGEKLGKAFKENENTIEFNKLWESLKSEYNAFVFEFKEPLNKNFIKTTVIEDTVNKTSEMQGLEGQVAYFQQSQEKMVEYLDKIKKLVTELKNKKKCLEGVLTEAIKNFDLAKKLVEDKGKLEVPANFNENNIVKRFESSWEALNRDIDDLRKKEVLNNSELNNAGIIAALADEKTINQCKERSESIQQCHDQMKNFFDKIKKLAAVSQKNETSYQTLIKEYDAYHAEDIEQLAETCKEYIDKIDVLVTEEKSLVENERRFTNGLNAALQEVKNKPIWKEYKKELCKYIEKYEKGKEALKQAIETPSKSAKTLPEYTSSEEIRKILTAIKNWLTAQLATKTE